MLTLECVLCVGNYIPTTQPQHKKTYIKFNGKSLPFFSWIPLSPLSCLSSRHSSPPSFRPLLYVETILDKYRSQPAVTAEQLHIITVQHFFNICPQISTGTQTQPTFRSVYQHLYRAAMGYSTPNVQTSQS